MKQETTASSPAPVHDEQREKDVQELCKAVLNAYPDTYYNPHGADSTTCPFCSKRVDYAEAEIADISHATTCGYFIAKDLSTKQ